MITRLIWLGVFILSASLLRAQATVALYSFYIDKEVDFSLMQSFSDDSKKMIQDLVSDPEFDLTPVLADFHTYFVATAAPLLPVRFISEEQFLANEVYATLENHNKYEKTEMYEPADGYMNLGRSFDESYLELMKSDDIDGLMSIQIQFFVRKNVLKTVIQAQLTASIYNKEGKKAWNYGEFGISKIGFTTVTGFVVSKQDEVIPMFESAMSDLKEKMNNNLVSRSKNATKKL